MSENDTVIELEKERPKLDDKPNLVLSYREAALLYDYFMNRAGYISYEFDAEIRSNIIPKLSRFLR